MKKMFKVKIQEILSRNILVEASNEIEAKDIVEQMYDNEEIILDYTDLQNVIIEKPLFWTTKENYEKIKKSVDKK